LTRETASTALKQEIELQIRPKKMKLQEGDFERIQEGWQTLGQSMGLDLERYRHPGWEKDSPAGSLGQGGVTSGIEQGGTDAALVPLDPAAQTVLD
ncbi:hypothetical protein, partial [Chromobacterium amazonense]|uniref:hypothetical protein n=1 Tax=Chromobacterium amazonense TaxID=1382803 RepID=UPI003F79C1D2